MLSLAARNELGPKAGQPQIGGAEEPRSRAAGGTARPAAADAEHARWRRRRRQPLWRARLGSALAQLQGPTAGSERADVRPTAGPNAAADGAHGSRWGWRAWQCHEWLQSFHDSTLR